MNGGSVKKIDDDGNTLSDALRRYEWDAENRLIAVTSSNVVDGSLTRVEFSYDYMSRRSLKKEYKWVNGQWSMVSSRSFLYDGWNLISEVCAATGRGTITDYYVWGLDLSGSLQGAGGIGGLLARYRSEQRYYDEQGMLLICHKPPGNPENEQTIRINETAWPAHASHGDTLGVCAGGSISNSAFLYTFDGNGNVSELLDLKSAIENRQFIVAHYEYSPFGETIVSTGPEAQDNPFRFSTKPAEDNTGLVLYEYRPYSPSLGRWLSRDPIGTKGGLNLYGFVRNAPTHRIDKLGLFCITYSTSDAVPPGYAWVVQYNSSIYPGHSGLQYQCLLKKRKNVIHKQLCTSRPFCRSVPGTEDKQTDSSDWFTDSDLEAAPPGQETPSGWCIAWAAPLMIPNPPTTW